MIAAFAFRLAQPWWLSAGLLAVPAVWLAWRSLGALGAVRRVAAIALRVLVICLLAVLLARPELARKHEKLTLIVVRDFSRSIPLSPVDLRALAVEYVNKAVESKPDGDQLAIIDVAEAALISRLPSVGTEIPVRNESLRGDQTALADGVELALAIAPPETAVRILVVSDGNETVGDLREVARVARANDIRIDVLPLQFRHEREIVFRRLVVPARASARDTINVRFVLGATTATRGRITLTLNGQNVDLDPTSDFVGAMVDLHEGTNVKSIQLPLGTRGMHEFQASFEPTDPADDGIAENNTALAMTFVAGPGHVLVVDPDGQSGAPLARALADENIDARYIRPGELTADLTKLLDVDGVVLVNTDVSVLTMRQQEMLCKYVTDLGGGLVMVGGPDAFGAGGWIGSPVASILPVDPDPKQKQVMPKGALVLIMHACEMPNGNYWGKQTAIAAVKVLSARDLVGVLDYSTGGGLANWVYPLSEAGDKGKVIAALKRMQMLDMPDFGAPMQAAYNQLVKAQAAQKHMILISDGDPSMPSRALLNKLNKAQITCTGVAVFPHRREDVASLAAIAQATGGRFYNVQNANQLPEIFIKEAQVVRRSLRVEETFTPKINASLVEMLGDLAAGGVPKLDGYILTDPKGGLARLAMVSEKGDPILANIQAGMGRVVAFTSSADSRWAAKWVSWGGFRRFWRQVVTWAAAGKATQATDCEINTDVHGRDVTVSIEAVSATGEFVQLGDIAGQAIAPDMTGRELTVNQVGPGQYRATFRAEKAGNYLINLTYRRPGSQEMSLIQSVACVPFAPEFEDLTDNSALLTEVAENITQGRILGGDPTKADLFSRDGVVYPMTSLPLTKPLLLVWLGLFLLDVAVRRIALDFRAMARRAVGWIDRLRGRRAARDETIDKLKARRDEVRRQLDARGLKRATSARYEAPAGAPQADLPMSDATAAAPEPERRPTEPEAAPTPSQEEDASSLGRLLRAKRKARDKMDEDRKG